MHQVIEKCILSDLELLNDTVGDISVSISDDITVDVLFNIKIILNELIINGIKHGNCCNKDKKVYIKLIIDDKFFDITVKDEGAGFKYCKNLSPCEYMECGRGLLIVEGLSDSFCVNNNAVICRKYF